MTLNVLSIAIPTFPAWAAMWLLAFAVFFACKGVTWADALRGQSFRGRVAAYFLAWPGMDPGAFLRRAPIRPIAWDHVGASVARVLVGAMLVWGVVPLVPGDRPLLAGWVGMIGLILMLHFGVLDLVGAAWRVRGVDATPLMNAPARARSVADFWGNRWNTAFHHLAHRYIFKPLRRPLGAPGATLATFLASGLVHDLVISVPARAGWGLPTAYFLVQGVAVLFERSTIGRRAGLGRYPLGRLFAAIVVIAPLPWLFHDAFVTRVILPFLEVIR